MEFLNYIIDTYNIPLLSAFILGIITSISPCPLATNITAISYISKNLGSTKQTLIHSFVYALWRIFSYSLIIFLIWWWFSKFSISSFFQWYGDKIVWPVLIFIWLVMINIIKLPSIKWSNKLQKFKESLNTKWYIGTFLLWSLFALAFCPYSWVIFFWVFIPLVLDSSFPLWLGLLYWFWTALPVIVFSILFVISIQKMSKVFNKVSVVERYLRYFIATIFILVWIYYSYLTLRWILVIL